MATGIRPPQKRSPVDWAEENLRLPPTLSAEPGRIRIRKRTPYLREIAESCDTLGVEEVVFVSGTQVGKTTWEEIVLGYWTDVEPGPTLIVKPSEDACTKYVKERWREIVKATPALSRHVSPNASDNTLDSIAYVNGQRTFLGWSGSPQALASRPCRRVILDEVDKFPPFSGREADPISLARERTRTFGYRRCVLICSTPTTRDGAIWKAFEACGVRLYFFVPCPHCGAMQRMTWDRVIYPKALAGEDKVKHADRVEQGKLANYECIGCSGKINDDHKPKMLERGEWRTESGERTKSKRIGFHMSSLYSPWCKFSEMAAEWIKCEGDLAATMNFRNSRLAEPFEVLTAKPKASIIRDKAAAGHKRFIVPDWTQLVIATADSQKDHYRYGVRAWGYGYRSRLIDCGMSATGDDLRQRTIDRTFAMANGSQVGCPILLIDSGGGRKDTASGDITARVYAMARQDPTRIRAAKGASTDQAEMVKESFLKNEQLLLWLLNTDRLKDQLFALINAQDETQWEVFADCGDDYAKEMAGEHKVFDRSAKREIWTKVTSGAPNHAWDWEVYQIAAAVKFGLGMMPTTPVEVPQPEPQQQQSQPRQSFVNSHRGQW